MNADGSGEEQFSRCSISPCFQPAWSPDGTRIAYEVGLSGGLGLIEVKASGQPAQTFSLDIASGLGGPAWAPDRARLVYPGPIDVLHSGLFTVNSDGTGAEWIGVRIPDARDASWGRHGRPPSTLLNEIVSALLLILPFAVQLPLLQRLGSPKIR